jgi:hypothetical protein
MTSAAYARVMTAIVASNSTSNIAAMTIANTMRETASTTMLSTARREWMRSLPMPHFHPAFSSRENSFNPLSIRERIETELK